MIGILALLFAAAPSVGAAYDGEYLPSVQQVRVDRSFSDIPIEARLKGIESRLSELRIGECDKWRECEWRDRDGVRYSFLAVVPSDPYVVVKRIETADFGDHAISALGIGAARKRGEVLEAARKFIPDTEFRCFVVEDAGETCQAMLSPGWVTIRFDRSGTLAEVKLDGYHIT